MIILFLVVLILLSLVAAILLNAKIFLLAFAAAYFVAFYLCRPAIFLVLIILIYQVRIFFLSHTDHFPSSQAAIEYVDEVDDNEEELGI